MYHYMKTLLYLMEYHPVLGNVLMLKREPVLPLNCIRNIQVVDKSMTKQNDGMMQYCNDFSFVGLLH